MNIFKNIFSTDKENETQEKANIESASAEQIDFANCAIDIFNPTMKQYGFKLVKFRLSEFSSTLIWVKGNCYVDLGGNTHPHDAPFYYGIVLGQFEGTHYYYSDRECVGLWKLKAIQDNLETVNDTPFPFGNDIEPSLIQTKNDLLKYSKNFLEGDLTQFYIARNKQ